MISPFGFSPSLVISIVYLPFFSDTVTVIVLPFACETVFVRHSCIAAMSIFSLTVSAFGFSPQKSTVTATSFAASFITCKLSFFVRGRVLFNAAISACQKHIICFCSVLSSGSASLRFVASKSLPISSWIRIFAAKSSFSFVRSTTLSPYATRRLLTAFSSSSFCSNSLVRRYLSVTFAATIS